MFDLKAFKDGIAKVLNISSAHEKLSEAAGQIETLSNEVTTLQGKITEFQNTTLPAKNKEWEDKVSLLNKEHTDKIEALGKEHQAEVEKIKASVSKEVTKELARTVPEGAIKETSEKSLSPDSSAIMAQIKAFRAKGLHNEASALYKKHRALFV